MVTRTALRDTDLGTLPADWEIVTLGEVGSCHGGLTYTPEDVSADGCLVLRASNIQRGQLVFEHNVFVKMDVPDDVLVQPGDLLICVRNGSRRLIGKSALVGDDAAGMAFGAFMSIFRSPDSAYVSHAFQAEATNRQIHSHLGATINQITNRTLNAIKVPWPPVRERRAIAQALSDADSVIHSLEQLVEKERDVKQATMQQLLTGRTRLPGFEGAWHRVALGSLGTLMKGRGIRRDEVTEFGVACARYGEIYTRYHNYTETLHSRVSTEVARTALPIRHGDLLFAGSGETADEIGKCIGYIGKEEAVAGGDIVVFRPAAQHDPAFFGHLLNHDEAARQKARLGQGDAVVHINARALAQVEVSLPSHDEQRAIASVLIDMDREVALLEERLAKVRDVKVGMMQQLLTGRTRLAAASGGAA